MCNNYKNFGAFNFGYALRCVKEYSSPWNCYSFYVNKHSEQLRGIPRLVINYRPLNTVFFDDTYPISHKGKLLARIAGAKGFSKFDMKSGFWLYAVVHGCGCFCNLLLSNVLSLEKYL